MDLKKTMADNLGLYMYDDIQSDIDSIVKREDILSYVSIYRTT
jgi:hypothetical protein